MTQCQPASVDFSQGEATQEDLCFVKKKPSVSLLPEMKIQFKKSLLNTSTISIATIMSPFASTNHIFSHLLVILFAILIWNNFDVGPIEFVRVTPYTRWTPSPPPTDKKESSIVKL